MLVIWPLRGGGMRTRGFLMGLFLGRVVKDTGVLVWQLRGARLVMIRGLGMWQFGGVGDEDAGASCAAVLARVWLCERMKRRATPVYARPLALRGGVAPRGELSFDLKGTTL